LPRPMVVVDFEAGKDDGRQKTRLDACLALNQNRSFMSKVYYIILYIIYYKVSNILYHKVSK